MSEESKKILITGANGFIAKNLSVYLEYSYKKPVEILLANRETTDEALSDLLNQAEFVVHLAGENRPKTEEGFQHGNVDFTKTICDLLISKGKSTSIIFSSSTQATLDNPYGRSKLEAEHVLQSYAEQQNANVYIYRLPNVFGKWAKPNYNSFVATLCHNVNRNLPITIHDESNQVTLVYIDDVIASFVSTIEADNNNKPGLHHCAIEPVYQKTVGELLAAIKKLHDSQQSLVIPAAEQGFDRAISATFQSYLPREKMTYALHEYSDERGTFYEAFKSSDNGQVSISTTKPGITRGNHFHHSKHEKFLVVQGKALFRFRHLITAEVIEVALDDVEKKIIEVPVGYTHNFTNVGDNELVVLLWANEKLDRDNPDTYFLEV